MREEQTEQVNHKGTPRGVKVKDMDVTRIPVSKINLGRNSRTSITYEELDGMMQAIKETGLLQPIGVIKKGSTYEVCYGNRRFLACSKLGWSSIPAVVWDVRHGFEADLMNLGENVQRRNLTINEIGRYIEIMKGEGLSTKEMAIKLGVTTKYLNDAAQAYKGVPEKFRDDIEVRNTPKKKGEQTKPGKLTMRQAAAITEASARYRLDKDQQLDLFKAAKRAGSKFKPQNMKKYALNILAGKDAFAEDVETKEIHIHLSVTVAEHERLYAKYIQKGPFLGMRGLAAAILKGEISEKIKTVN